MSDTSQSAPVSGTCTHCGCPHSYASTRKGDAWRCCGACAGSDRCACGCKPDLATERVGDVFVPTRRMFGARAPDGVKAVGGKRTRQRAFPFADKPRGR